MRTCVWLIGAAFAVVVVGCWFPEPQRIVAVWAFLSLLIVASVIYLDERGWFDMRDEDER